MSPSTASEKIKKLTTDFLSGSAIKKHNLTNQVFLEFVKIAVEKQTVLTETTCMNPLNPRAANSILNSTVIGRASKVLKKINNTSTMWVS